MQKFKYTIDGKDYEVNIEEAKGEEVIVEVNGSKYNVKRHLNAPAPKKAQPARPVVTAAPKPKPAAAPTPSAAPAAAGGSALVSPLPGVILDVCCKVGDVVKKHDKLLVLEAMKMENDIKADRDGTITAIHVSKNESVQEGAQLVTIG